MHADGNEVANKPVSRNSLVRALVLFVATAAFLWQWWNPFVRFASPAANNAVGFVIVLALPWWATVEFARVGRWWGTAIAALTLLPLLLYSLLVLLASAMSGDGGFERFSEIEWRGSKIALYLTNGGATTDFGVVLRQEKVVFPGVRAVRNIDYLYPCHTLRVDAAGSGITVSSGEYCPALPGPRSYRLRRFVYF
jgi:hypothetical protein